MWEKKEIEKDKLYAAGIGSLRLFLKAEKDELHIASDYEKEERSLRSIQPSRRPKSEEQPSWMRCIVGEGLKTVQLSPVFPDKPVVVRPKYEIKIPPNSDALFFINIPIWVRVMSQSTGGGEKRHAEFPSIPLSKTWFGDTLSGELCYSLKTRAMRGEAESLVSPYMVTCPLQVRNSSEDILDFERICLHVEYMSVYTGTERLWSNTVFVVFRGADQVSQISFSPDAPRYERGCDKLSEPRQTSVSSLVRRSFYLLKNLTGF